MEKIKVMTVFGTRPEAIKMAPLVKELERCEKIESIVCVTAQHREMLDQVLDIFDIKPDYDLDIMQQRQSLTTITTRALEGLDEVIKKVQPDMVLVHGDTSTTFAGSLAAFYNKVKVGHVEAGLRTFDKYFPYPEEINRKLTGVLADLHFAPTETNKLNLINEAIKEDTIYITGNTVIDALKTTVKEDYKFKTKVLQDLKYEENKTVLVTAHRRENLGQPLRDICSALKQLAEQYEDVEIVYPVHLNPIIKDTVFEILGNVPRVHLIEPLDVEELHNLMKRCYLVLTDSGGLQEEAPSLGKPVLVLRNETERPEAVAAGTVKVAGVNKDEIVKLSKILIDDYNEYSIMAKAVNPYGDGNASFRIVQAIQYYFGLTVERISDFDQK
ncbi:UDP-N-acetylglucosamine 2-epimerase (non-hydrolyzing) [Petroclostridium sp. X23]|uniref:non-hydrolyzing UDP-N-acetylglucosamine 2-epimerase n=1 Tax=Petroclostridium sp. X23 TaxID=3045146 RepID=UPI0024ADDC30|nr:UDP-N-acetylglucosamine 2-epimerase (non-hydrolyzing) [Petroclostridium sp. X23]WHH57576.1 UDP-N-acetylglucosamine 2-epimerase (non-hydrolyzing) [Petroclostridium sp. X23]